MKKNKVFMIATIASVMTVCLCILCRGRKAKTIPENKE